MRSSLPAICCCWRRAGNSPTARCNRPAGTTLPRRRATRRSIISATEMMEASNRGQIGQPAAFDDFKLVWNPWWKFSPQFCTAPAAGQAANCRAPAAYPQKLWIKSVNNGVISCAKPPVWQRIFFLCQKQADRKALIKINNLKITAVRQTAQSARRRVQSGDEPVQARPPVEPPFSASPASTGWCATASKSAFPSMLGRWRNIQPDLRQFRPRLFLALKDRPPRCAA